MIENFNIKKCDICGKSFFMSVGHIYKRIKGTKTLVFCSYSCNRKAEREVGASKQEEKEQEKIKRELKGDLAKSKY